MTDSPAPLVAVVVVAAGSGTRLGHDEPKAFAPVASRPMLEWALRGVFGMQEPAQVIVVAPEAKLDDAREIVDTVAGVGASDGASIATTPVSVVAGGSSRSESVRRGLAVLLPGIRTVLVHDAARALTPSGLFDAVVVAVGATGHGIVPGLQVVDTIKNVDSAGAILGTVDRSELSAVQTPQGFPRDVLVSSLFTSSDDATDDAAIVAADGHEVSVVAGDQLAFKITTPWDLRRAELLLGSSPAVSAPAVHTDQPVPRVGTGVDVHAFDDTSPLWLAGLYWPDERGLSGHSDGDAVSHAICDALLSAAGLGDIGGVFGTSNERFTGAHGEVFLMETVRLVTDAGYRICNVSVQLVGNRPKLAPRRSEAEAVLSGIVAAPVSLSATTTDALGFTGRGEGVAALATALLMPVTGGAAHLNWEA